MGVYINGIGAVSEAALTAEDFVALAEGREYTAKGQKTEFVSSVPASKLRRASRYAKLAVTAADLALTGSGAIILPFCRALNRFFETGKVTASYAMYDSNHSAGAFRKK
jgi:hypothetical protein